MNKKILNLINQYIKYGEVYTEVLENGVYTEKDLKKELIELFKENNYTNKEFSVNIITACDYPGGKTIIIYVAYINKKYKNLEVIQEILDI